MRVIYDPETDTLTMIFAEIRVAESDEEKPGMILDYDATGHLVSLEILEASRRVTLPTRIDYQVGSSSTEGWPQRSNQSACHKRDGLTTG